MTRFPARLVAAFVALLLLGFAPPPTDDDGHRDWRGRAIGPATSTTATNVEPTSVAEPAAEWITARDLRILFESPGYVANSSGLAIVHELGFEQSADRPVWSLVDDAQGLGVSREALAAMTAYLSSATANRVDRLLLTVVVDVPATDQTVSFPLYARMGEEGTLQFAQVTGAEAGRLVGAALLVPWDAAPVYLDGLVTIERTSEDGVHHRESYDLRPYPFSSLYPVQHGFVEVRVAGPLGDSGRFAQGASDGHTAEGRHWSCYEQTNYGYCTRWTVDAGSNENGTWSQSGVCSYRGQSYDSTAHAGADPTTFYRGNNTTGFTAKWKAENQQVLFGLRIGYVGESGSRWGGFASETQEVSASGPMNTGYAGRGPDIHLWREHTERSCNDEPWEDWGDDRYVQKAPGAFGNTTGWDIIQGLTESKEFKARATKNNWNALVGGSGWDTFLVWRAGTFYPMVKDEEYSRMKGTMYGVTFNLPGAPLDMGFKVDQTTYQTVTHTYRGKTLGGTPIDSNDYLHGLVGLPGSPFSDSPIVLEALIDKSRVGQCGRVGNAMSVPFDQMNTRGVGPSSTAGVDIGLSPNGPLTTAGGIIGVSPNEPLGSRPVPTAELVTC